MMTISPVGRKAFAMKYTLQVFTGFRDAPRRQPEEVIRAVRDIASRVRVEQVIIGWSADPAFYRQVGSFLRAAGIRMILWLPAFAGTGGPGQTDEAVDLYGSPVRLPPGQEGEGFSFHCPSSRRNLRFVTDFYSRHFSGCGFDGVFLDRIRSQSFLAGVSGVLGCGCERCRRAFLERGVDLSAVRDLYERRRDAFFDMAAYPPDGRFEPENALAGQFFDAKEQFIADAAADLCRHFHSLGLLVGLDLFAPLVSRFVGQDYALLARHADFIKPMLYRRTDAPAGIGFEYALWEKHAPEARGRARFSMDRAFMDTQLQALRGLPCECLPGIEVNYDPDLVHTDPEYITESLSAIRDRGFDSAALSWNILQAPPAHLEAIFKFST